MPAASQGFSPHTWMDVTACYRIFGDLFLAFHPTVHPLSWGGGLSTSVTQRAMPAGAQKPSRVTQAGEVKG